MRILFATSVLARGHGVSLVISQLAKHIKKSDPDTEIGIAAISHDLEYAELLDSCSIAVIPCSHASAERVIRNWCADVFIPHTDPFFSIAPAGSRIIVYEHGDPSPYLFASDQRERHQQRLAKQQSVYGAADAVVAISEFQRHDLPWPQASVIYNGCDHVSDFGHKSRIDFAHDSDSLFRIGVLSRLDGGEAQYKGFEILRELKPSLEARIPNLSLEYCGKISSAHAESLRSEGWSVYSGVSNQERDQWLRRCHLTISPSLWEGFNLPLVESQALGTIALAFDTGAHPEVTPFVCGNISEMAGLVFALHQDRDLLERYSVLAYQFARNRFKWEISADLLMKVVKNCL